MASAFIQRTSCRISEARQQLRGALPLAGLWRRAGAETHAPTTKRDRALILAGASWRVTSSSASALWRLCCAMGHWVETAELEPMPEDVRAKDAKQDSRFQRFLKRIAAKRSGRKLAAVPRVRRAK